MRDHIRNGFSLILDAEPRTIRNFFLFFVTSICTAILIERITSVMFFSLARYNFTTTAIITLATIALTIPIAFVFTVIPVWVLNRRNYQTIYTFLLFSCSLGNIIIIGSLSDDSEFIPIPYRAVGITYFIMTGVCALYFRYKHENSHDDYEFLVQTLRTISFHSKEAAFYFAKESVEYDLDFFQNNIDELKIEVIKMESHNFYHPKSVSYCREISSIYNESIHNFSVLKDNFSEQGAMMRYVEKEKEIIVSEEELSAKISLLPWARV